MVKDELTHKNELEITRNELEFNISAVTGEGFDRLLAQLARQAENFLAGSEDAAGDPPASPAGARGGPGGAQTGAKRRCGSHEDLLAEELRIAARALGRLTGRVDVEDILDVIFRDFCIGK